MDTKTKTTIMWGFFSAFYLYVVGPFAFMALEGGRGNEAEQVNVSSIKLSLGQELNLSAAVMDLVFSRLQESNVLHVTSEDHFDPWTYASCLTFSFTLISTIGWGYIAPVTFWGRLFTIFYSLFGIPIYALFLRCMGVWFKGVLTRGLKRVEVHFRGQENVSGLHIKSTIVITILVLAVLFCGAEIFSKRNKWTYFEGFYFCFISLTTIGLGDLYYVFHTPEQSTSGYLTDLFSSLIFVMGLCLVSTVLCQMSETLEELNYNGKKAVVPFEDSEIDRLSQNGMYEIEEHAPVDIVQSTGRRNCEVFDSVVEEKADNINIQNSNYSIEKVSSMNPYTRNEERNFCSCLNRSQSDLKIGKNRYTNGNMHDNKFKSSNKGVLRMPSEQKCHLWNSASIDEKQTNGDVCTTTPESCSGDINVSERSKDQGHLRSSCPHCPTLADHDVISDCECCPINIENETSSTIDLQATQDESEWGKELSNCVGESQNGDLGFADPVSSEVYQDSTPKISPPQSPRTDSNGNALLQPAGQDGVCQSGVPRVSNVSGADAVSTKVNQSSSPKRYGNAVQQHGTNGRCWQTGVTTGNPV